jgi:hypothetical protein
VPRSAGFRYKAAEGSAHASGILGDAHEEQVRALMGIMGLQDSILTNRAGSVYRCVARRWW